MRVLITGASGMLGHRLMIEAAKKNLEVTGTYHCRPLKIKGCPSLPLEVTSINQVKKVLEKTKPQVVVHTAALTNVDYCEENPEEAFKINAEGTKNICQVCLEKGVKVVYISTDFIFDGKKGMYREDDLPKPLSVYAQSKLEGEKAVEKLPDFLIFRCTIYGWHLDNQKSIPEWVISKLSCNKPIKAFADRIINPTYTGFLSSLILKSLEQNLSGIFHIGSQEPLTVFEFALKTAEVFSLDISLISKGKMSEASLKAKRPKNSSLNTKKIEKALNIKMPQVKKGLLQMKKERELAKKWII